eukprot:CAMPEP_0176047176 /NCGR_PEP_ID=MMETSP0120_2-20121206/23429_1 /TAXON_ID=160619 /ORGANISM="Kryptoperidinium foliaceum, Strain CCMP 1326" /LENGTH=86 /DNA_ID=CAMNT_0017380591 /DNA_START=56 /DNA_END=316 /DNA_ORIENTATION=-
MNALARASTTLPRRVVGQRNYSREVVDKINNKPIWLSDISTYPVIFVCSAACVGAFGYIGWKTMTHPDVCIDKNKRGTTLRWWGAA